MRFLVVLPIFVFLTAGCGAQQDRINAAQQKLSAAEDYVAQADLDITICQGKLLDIWQTYYTEKQLHEEAPQANLPPQDPQELPAPCDVGALDDRLTDAINAKNADYASLKAMPGAPAQPPPMDIRAFDKAIDRRLIQEDSYASDCDRGQASACIQYQQALQQDRDREMQEHEDFERGLENPVIIVPMY